MFFTQFLFVGRDLSTKTGAKLLDIINVPIVRPVSVLFNDKYSEKSSYHESCLTFLICFGDSFGMRVLE